LPLQKKEEYAEVFIIWQTVKLPLRANKTTKTPTNRKLVASNCRRVGSMQIAGEKLLRVLETTANLSKIISF